MSLTLNTEHNIILNVIRLKNIANFMLQQALLWISPINIILKVINFVKLSILPLRTLLVYGIIICTSYLLLLLFFI